MERRQLGRSGFKVPVLTFGTGTFGGSNEFFRAWGGSGVEAATRQVDLCLDAGVYKMKFAQATRSIVPAPSEEAHRRIERLLPDGLLMPSFSWVGMNRMLVV